MYCRLCNEINHDTYTILLNKGYLPQYPDTVYNEVLENGFIVRYPFRIKESRYVLCFHVEKGYTYDKLKEIIEQKLSELIKYV